jgi:hypothetical protein
MVVTSRIVASFSTRLSSTKLKYSVAEPEPESESELPKPYHFAAIRTGTVIFL